MCTRALLQPSGVPLCYTFLNQGLIGWQITIHALQLSGKGGLEHRSGGGGHWVPTVVQDGGAEVIHFKGKINNTINPCRGHCRGGEGRIHAGCWMPVSCGTDILIC